MSKEITLHFFCGKMAAGKSTLAKALASENAVILLSEDDWLSTLYPEEIADISGYVKYSTRLQNILTDHVQSILSSGVSVVLDFPGNTENQRKWFRSIFEKSNVSHILHFIDAGDDLCKRQLFERSKNKPEGAAFTTEAEFDMITTYFQPPNEAEGFNIVKYDRETI